MPLTAAMTGFQRSLALGPMASRGSSVEYGEVGCGTSAVRSMPVQKAWSPAPVRTMTLMSSRNLTSRQRAVSSAAVVRSMALWRAGRSRVTTAMPSLDSYR
jgi:hypothetical protein